MLNFLISFLKSNTSKQAREYTVFDPLEIHNLKAQLSDAQKKIDELTMHNSYIPVEAVKYQQAGSDYQNTELESVVDKTGFEAQRIIEVERFCKVKLPSIFVTLDDNEQLVINNHIDSATPL